ncbi:MAG: 30S ribosomal protein S7 [Candidatus Hepatoplasma vulgare]|nr:MAG: 30S ribosomal protein S7 [Candidatus Hepatoplasma sp.]
MSRKKQIYDNKKRIQPDPVYKSEVITKLINNIMLDGKRGIAQKILYSAFEIVEKETNEKAIDVFNKALDNVMPTLELKVRRVGGSNYQIPIEVSEKRRKILGLRWMVQYSRKRNEKTMELRLAKEIIDASNNVGSSVKKKDDTHKMAEANRAFAHFRW